MENQYTNIHVIGISGSLRPQSYTRMAVQQALLGAEEVGATTGLVDLREYKLICSDGKRDESELPKEVLRLRDELRQAQGMIIGTPEYHGSFSGVLKNALDLMGFPEFEGKIIGLAGVAGGVMGATHSLDGLRVVGRALRAWVLPQQVSIPEAWKVFDASGAVKDQRIKERLISVGQQVARFAYLHSAEEALQFIQAWEHTPENPGG